MKTGSVTKKALTAISTDGQSNQSLIQKNDKPQKPKTAPGEMFNFLEKESVTFQENKELIIEKEKLENDLKKWDDVIVTKKYHQI